MGNKIVELMAVPSGQRDVPWLMSSLQAAVELELSTLPPYLCGMWSITDSSQVPGLTVYQLIDSVVKEEMTHMGLACNLLTAIGGTPQIANGYATNISYPGPLPGGVRPELIVYLGGLSKPYIHDVYMQIEYPEDGPIPFTAAEEGAEIFPTIGAFYDAIQLVFALLEPALSLGNQQTVTYGGLDVTPILTMQNVNDAIDLIKIQGEGTSTSPSTGTELAHYYRFAEIYVGSTLVQGSGGSYAFNGPAIPFPNTYTMAPIPAGGYVNPSTPAQSALNSFNALFSSLLDNLDTAWSTGSQSAMSAAIGTMRQLNAAATPLFTIPLPLAEDGFYGPDFVYIPQNARKAPMDTSTTAAPVYSDIVTLLATLTGNDPNIGNAPHGAFWTLSYDAFIAQQTDNWGVPGSLVVKGSPSTSNLYLALAGQPPFGSFPPRMPDVNSDPNGRYATPAELQMVSTWITNNCPES